jgi:hypothetical protein
MNQRLAETRLKMKQAIDARWRRGYNNRARCPSLRRMAEYIEAMLGYRTEIVEGYYNTDRKPRGFRYITSSGKGRRGNRLLVFDAADNKLLDHNSAETYRHNTEVASWILRQEQAAD